MRLAHACPGCRRRLDAGAVVCVQCGYDTRTGNARQTRITRLKERGAEKRERRAERVRWQRWAPLGAGLAQTCLIAAVAYSANGDAAAERLFLKGTFAYATAAGVLMLMYALGEDGWYALVYPEEAWLLLYGDDCSPWLLGIVINAMLAGAAAGYLVLVR